MDMTLAEFRCRCFAFGIRSVFFFLFGSLLLLSLFGPFGGRGWRCPRVGTADGRIDVSYDHRRLRPCRIFCLFYFSVHFFFCFVLIGIRWPPCRGIRAHVRTCRSRARARLDVPARFTFTFVPVIVAHRVALVYTNWPCLIVIPWLCNHLSLWPYRYVLAYTNLYKRFIYIYI